MITGETTNGFKFEIEDKALDNWELLEIIDELDKNPQRIVKVAKIVLGMDQLEALKESCREDGIVSLSKMSAEISEILNSNKETKN